MQTVKRLLARILRLRATITMFAWRHRLAALGCDVQIYPSVKIYRASQVHVGDNVVLNDFVHIWGAGGVTIGANTLIAASVVITSQTHDSRALSKGLLYRQTNLQEPVRIGENVWIGSGAIIMPGVFVGDNAIVAAGAVVTKSVDAETIVGGVPAVVLRPNLREASDDGF